jgi:hypothetical protein
VIQPNGALVENKPKNVRIDISKEIPNHETETLDRAGTQLLNWKLRLCTQDDARTLRVPGCESVCTDESKPHPQIPLSIKN